MAEPLLSALCLVAVLEGLFLFISPESWKRMAAQLYRFPVQRLRMLGAVVVALGLLGLWVVRRFS